MGPRAARRGLATPEVYCVTWDRCSSWSKAQAPDQGRDRSGRASASSPIAMRENGTAKKMMPASLLPVDAWLTLKFSHNTPKAARAFRTAVTTTSAEVSPPYLGDRNIRPTPAPRSGTLTSSGPIIPKSVSNVGQRASVNSIPHPATRTHAAGTHRASQRRAIPSKTARMRDVRIGSVRGGCTGTLSASRSRITI
jgi:hypothetical protein